MKVITEACGALMANMYVVYDDCYNAIVIDPIDADKLSEILDSTSLSLKAIFLTHGHFDHACGLKEIKARYPVTSYVYKDDAELLSDPYKNASMLLQSPIDLGSCSDCLSDQEVVTFGEITVKVHHTPGHTMGSVCYEIDGCLFSGDTMFCGGVGRTDLYGGNSRLLSDSLQKLSHFPENLTVYPGHGSKTTLFREKKYNPYMN